MIEGFKYLKENEEGKREDNIIHVTKAEETGGQQEGQGERVVGEEGNNLE